MNLKGSIQPEHFLNLANSLHPHDSAMPLLRKTTSQTYVNEHGDTVKTMARRAAWDCVLSAPKSLSLAGLVGGDHRILEAIRASVQVAANELERYTDARMGGSKAPERTGKWVAAIAEHHTSRPVNGVTSPQIHHHMVVFNVTEAASGKLRSLQTREMMKSQQLVTQIYRSELAVRMTNLGYTVIRGPFREPQLAGFTADYLSASSPRRNQIKAELAELGFSGAAAAQIAAHRTREGKIDQTPEEIRRQHQELAAEHGNQPQKVVAEALARSRGMAPEHDLIAGARDAVEFARAKGIERNAVVDERTMLVHALDRGQGHTTLGPIREEFQRRVEAGEFLEREPSKGSTAGRAFTTPETVDIEQDLIQRMRAGQNQYGPLLSPGAIDPHLNADQRQAVEHIRASRDQITGLNGLAGAGKTYALTTVNALAGRNGYVVQGLAPTSTATSNLAHAGMPTQTLQRHIMRGSHATSDLRPRLYVLDEASLASDELVHKFIANLRPYDRVLMVGDTRQHQAIDAGKPFELLQTWGMRTATLTNIIRQTNPQYREAVEKLAAGKVREGLKLIDGMGQMHGIPKRSERLAFVTEQFLKDPHNTLIVAPENKSRDELNAAIHTALQESRTVDSTAVRTPIFVDRKEMTGTDRAYADRYSVGDTLRYSKGSKVLPLAAGEYVTVTGADRATNTLTVQKASGERVTYDPARLKGVSVYEPQERSFAPGDRIQFTAKSQAIGVDNRQLGTLTAFEAGKATVLLETGRTVTFKVADHPHFDHGYCLTSFTAQGETVDRVIVYVDNSRAHENITNQRLAYVAGSRGRHEAIIVTDDKPRAYANLERDVSERVAILPEAPEHGYGVHP